MDSDQAEEIIILLKEILEEMKSMNERVEHIRRQNG